MSNMNMVPVVIQQTVESLLDPNTPENIKFNHKNTLQNIIEVSQAAIAKHDKSSNNLFARRK